MQNDIALLDMMKKDQDNQQGLYHPGPYWKGYSSRTAKAIHFEGLKSFRSNPRIAKGYGDQVLIHPFDLSSLDSWKEKLYKKIIEIPVFKKYFIEPYIKHNLRHFQETQKYKNLYFTNILGEWFSQFSEKYNLPDTLIANPSNTVTIRDCKIGRCYLDAFLRLHNYSSQVDFSSVESVFEIGGGFGAWAHTLLHCFPNIKKYLYLDIPPILYVGTQYLKNFYKEELISYRETRNMDSIRFTSGGKREIIAVCPWQIERISANIDVFYNSASFQEMDEDMVINYSKHIKRMINDSSKICLLIYNGGKPEKTLLAENLLKIIEDNIPVEFKELEPEIEISDSHYFIASRKQ